MERNAPQFESVLISPEIAKQLFDSRIKNRTINWKRVHLYTEEMKAGRWRMNGETIKVNADGRLLDGQHRCLAVMDYGKPVWFSIAKAVDTEAFATMDSGYPRRASQVLGMQDIKNSVAVCGIVGRKDEIERTGMYFTGGRSRERLGTNEAVLNDYYQDSKGYDEAADIACLMYRKLRLFAPTFTGSIFYYLRHSLGYDYDQCAKFFTTLHTLGDNTIPQAAILRDLVLKKQVNNAVKLKNEYAWCLIAKVWNKYVKNEPIRCLNYAPEVEGQIKFIPNPYRYNTKTLFP